MLQIRGVSYAYEQQDVRALSDVTVEVAPGESVAVVGRNGCGKSTLARVANASLEPLSGTLSVDGMPIDFSDTSSRDLAAMRVGFVRQDPTRQIVATTVMEEVSFGPLNLGLTPSEARSRAREALDACGLLTESNRLATALSGGQKQLLALAGVLAMRPSYLVLDEAFCQLDPESRSRSLAVVEDVRATGVGVLHITHDPGEMARADRLVVMDSGRVAWQGPAAGLCDPQVRELVRGVTLLPLSSSQDDKDRAAREFASAAGAVSSRPGFAGEGLECRGLSVSFGGTPVLSNVDLDLRPGKLTVVTGASGAGKTTLASVLAGIEEPSSGTVRLYGSPVKPGSVGYCMQRSHDMLLGPTVLDDISLAPLAQGLSHDETAVRVRAACDTLGIAPELHERQPLSLSGGQRRRVALAGLYAQAPRAYVFDEPTIGLDKPGTLAFARFLGAILADGACVCVLTHEPDLFRALADEVLHLADGRLEAAHA